MGMRLGDAWHISLQSIATYKKRSIMTVVSISVLFALIMLMSFLLSGLERSVLDASATQLGGKTYVETRFVDDSVRLQGGRGGSSEVLTDTAGIVAARIAKYDGEVVGSLKTYRFDTVTKAGSRYNYNPTFYKVFDVGAIKDFLTADLTTVPEGKVPVLVQERYANDPTNLNPDYFVVGVLPNTRTGALTVPNAALINFLFSFISSPNVGYGFLVDDGSGRVDRFFDRVEEQCREAYRVAYDEEPTSMTTLSNRDWPEAYTVATFADPFNASRYRDYFTDGAEFGYDIFTGDYRTYGLFSNTIDVAAGFFTTEWLLMIVEVVFLIIAVWIATATFSHLIGQEAQTIALYRSFGAKSGDILLIYFCYMLQLCLLAVGLCVVLALLVAGVIALMDASKISQALQSYYYLDVAPKVNMVGFDWRFPTVILTILLIAPLSLLCSIRSFSSKNIAKKLKEE